MKLLVAAAVLFVGLVERVFAALYDFVTDSAPIFIPPEVELQQGDPPTEQLRVPISPRALRRHHARRTRIRGKNGGCPRRFKEDRFTRRLTNAELGSEASFHYQVAELRDISPIADMFMALADLPEKDRRLEVCLRPGADHEWIRHHMRWFAWKGRGRTIWIRGYWRRQMARKKKV